MRFLDVGLLDESFFADIAAGISPAAAEEARELTEGLSELSPRGCESAVAVASGCLLIRIYDEGYAFPYPYPLTDSADVESALLSLSEYTRRELLPPVLTDVPREELDTVGRVFHRISAAAYDDDEDMFFVRARSECEGFVPDESVSRDGVSLAELTDRDGEVLYRLATDTELNKYWGYDYREDNPSPDVGYFLRVAEGERAAGVAMSLAVREAGRTVGEAVIFNFDYRGSAEVGVRILSEYHGRGLGSRAMELLISVAEEMGLSQLRAEVMLENAPSLALVRKYFTESGSDGIKALFVRPLI